MATLQAVAARAESAGALRSLNAFVAECDPDVIVLYRIGAGDALAFATRFARGWGYHRGKAIFIKAPLKIAGITHRFLPGSWWRRSILHIDARPPQGSAISVLAVTISRRPHRRDAQLERLRDHLAQVESASLVLEPERAYTSGAQLCSSYRQPLGNGADAFVANVSW